MDRQDLDRDLDLALPPDLPPSDGEAPRPRPPAPPATGPSAGWLLTFVLVVFGALELQTILVMFVSADAGGGVTATLVFGLLFLVSVLAWFIGGMLWFASKFDRR
jgi:hypothetical protein